jgi:hypothetical protein
MTDRQCVGLMGTFGDFWGAGLVNFVIERKWQGRTKGKKRRWLLSGVALGGERM